MDTMTLAVAGVAALGILLIAVGRRDPARLRVSATGSSATPAADESRSTSTGQGASAELIAQSQALTNLNKVVEQRDFGANLARDIARADLKLKPSEFLCILGGVDGRHPAPDDHPAAFVPSCRPLDRCSSAPRRLHAPALLARTPQERPPQRLQQAAPGHHHAHRQRPAAGSSFLQAIEIVVRESRPPISTEFARVIREVNLGLPFEQALENMVRRVRSDDLELMATAISIQHQVGGNLAEILDSIAYTIRERVRIKGEIRTLTAQQRLSGYVVGFLPIGLAGFLFVAAPGFMEPMFAKPAGARAAGRRRHPRRRVHDVHRLHVHPQHRGHRGLADGCHAILIAAARGGPASS